MYSSSVLPSVVDVSCCSLPGASDAELVLALSFFFSGPTKSKDKEALMSFSPHQSTHSPLLRSPAAAQERPTTKVARTAFAANLVESGVRSSKDCLAWLFDGRVHVCFHRLDMCLVSHKKTGCSILLYRSLQHVNQLLTSPLFSPPSPSLSSVDHRNLLAGGREGIEEDLRAGGDLRHGPQQDEGDRRGVPREGDPQRGRHRARLLQRRPASGHQGEK